MSQDNEDAQIASHFVLKPEEMEELAAITNSVTTNLEKLVQIIANHPVPSKPSFLVSADGKDAVFRLFQEYSMLRLQQRVSEEDGLLIEQELNDLEESLQSHFKDVESHFQHVLENSREIMSKAGK